MRRRQFLGLCGSSALVGTGLHRLAQADGYQPNIYDRARLVDSEGRPIQAGELEQGVNYVFHYPYQSTPAFLLKLEHTPARCQITTEDGAEYQWPGGTGPDDNIVAFCAICPHQLSYPSKAYTFISYRQERSEAAGQARAVTCCAHHSAFEVGRGGAVVAGPAPDPLTTILLEHDADTDNLYATGTLGPELYSAFFKAYAADLRQAYGPGEARASSGATSVVSKLEDFSEEVITC